MLHSPDPKTARILELADYFDNLAPCDYDQANPECCIWGHIARRYLKLNKHLISAGVQDFFEVDSATANKIYGSHPDGCYNPTPAVAARMLRHFAITGEVKWQK